MRFVFKLLTLSLSIFLLTPFMPAHAVEVEEYTPYQGQVSCDPKAKPGTTALSKLVMRKFGGKSSGIGRSCNVGGLSEHKEGRAWDWRLNANNAKDRKRASKAIKWLTEEVNGIPAYRAKRMGVMYIIWNRKMWRGYSPEQGWQKYTGDSAHRDHMHISLTWSGAMKNTSWYTRNPVMDYGPCQVWVNELARPWKKVNLTPCGPAIKRPKANAQGIYKAQYGETVNRVARFFSKTPEQIRRWNAWPETGPVSILEGQRIWVKKPPA